MSLKNVDNAMTCNSYTALSLAEENRLQVGHFSIMLTHSFDKVHSFPSSRTSICMCVLHGVLKKQLDMTGTCTISWSINSHSTTKKWGKCQNLCYQGGIIRRRNLALASCSGRTSSWKGGGIVYKHSLRAFPLLNKTIVLNNSSRIRSQGIIISALWATQFFMAMSTFGCAHFPMVGKPCKSLFLPSLRGTISPTFQLLFSGLEDKMNFFLSHN